MTVLIIIGIIAAIIALIMLIPIGADIGYENNIFTLSAKACGVLLQLLPKESTGEKPPKEKKPKKYKKKKEEKKKPEGEKSESEEKKEKKGLPLGLTIDDVIKLLKVVFKGLGKFRKFKVDRFLLHYVASGNDPYDTAVTFGYVNAALSALAPVCRRRFACKDVDVYTDIDFNKEKMKIDFGLGFSIRIGQIFSVINTILFGAIWIVIKRIVVSAFNKVLNKLKRKKTTDADIE